MRVSLRKMVRGFAVTIMAGIIISSMAVDAFAADAMLQSGSTSVTATVSNTYTLTIPEKIALTSSAKGSGTYTGTISVKLSGNIAKTAKITVSASKPLMHAEGSSSTMDRYANCSLSKQTWSFDDVKNGVSSNCTISAELTPGNWSGTCNISATLSNG